MNVTCIFFLGVVIAIISVLPPGLLNISAAKIAVNESRSRGILFSVGASIIVLLQTYLATLFARYLSMHQEVIDVLRIIAFVVFVIITIYFLLIAKEKEKKERAKLKSKKNSFFYGMFLSALNIFPIPYQAYMTITLSSFGWMDFSKKSIFSYMFGVAIGSLLTFYAYILFFEKVKGKTFTSQKKMNYLIGTITGVISVITLVNIIRAL